MENINKLAMIVPVHPPKMKWYENMCESYIQINPDIDLYFVIDMEDLDTFKKSLYYDDNMTITCINTKFSKSPATYKKLQGIYKLHQTKKYQGYSTIDCESIFLNTDSKFSFHESFEKFCDNKEIICYPSDVDFLINIQKISSDFFPENEKLAKFKTQYSFWNQIPWYEDRYIEEFLKDINYEKDHFLGVKWEVFAQLVYQAWLLHKDYFHISNIQFRLEYPEDMKPEERKIFDNYQVDWIRYGARKAPFQQNQTPLLYFHLDRMDSDAERSLSYYCP